MSTRKQKNDSARPSGARPRPEDVQTKPDVKRLAEIFDDQVRRLGELESRLDRLEKAARSRKPSGRKRAKR